MKGQSAAIALLVACAVSVFVGAVATYRSLNRSQLSYYQEYQFADVFARLKRAPESLTGRIERIPGVSVAYTRVVADASLEVPGFNEPVTALIVSIPGDTQPPLNMLHLRSGRLPVPGAGNEVLASEAFANAQRIAPGDTLTAVINGRRHKIMVTGVALSPEFVYQVRPGDLMPDDRRYGVFWMPRRPLAAAMNLEGSFNDLAIRLAPGAVEKQVLADLDALLGQYGGMGAGGRDRHVSHRFLSDEIRQLKSTAIVVPSIFLGVAAFLLNVVFSRLISTQREQVAALKAFGYGNLEIGVHYVKLVTLIVIIGALVGIYGGYLMGSGMTRMYASYYRLPVYQYGVDIPSFALAAALAITAGVAGVAGSVRRAVSLPPAEAMRPEPPASYKPTFIDRMGFGRFLPQAPRMILRNIERTPLRTFLSALGIAFSVAILVIGSFFEDSLDLIMDLEFRQAWRGDVTVTFVSPVPARAAAELSGLPGVTEVEPFRAVPAVLRAGHRSYHTAITGMVPEPRLRRLLDGDGRPVAIPANGIMLTRKLGEILGVVPGDTLLVEVLEGTRPVRSLQLSSFSDEIIGVSAWMDIGALDRLMGTAPLVSGAFLAVEKEARPALYRELSRRPGVAGVTLRDAMLKSFQDVSADNILIFSSVLIMFAMAIAAGVVYNGARVSLAERERELATLRVIGFTRAEISAILLGELAVQVALAIPLGCWLGASLSKLSAIGVESDLFRLPVVISGSTYMFAIMTVIAASAVVALTVRHRLDHLDLVSVLKSKE
jgi:putative ABC transport system permease protein